MTRNTDVISVSVPPGTKDRLVAMAEEESRTLSNYLSILLLDHIRKESGEEPQQAQN